MSKLSYALSDSATMLRRNLRHALRYPVMTVSALGIPVILLLLFVGVLGGTLGAGLRGTSPGGGGYINYVAPGIIVMGVASGCVATSVGVCVDMTDGIVNRFRAMGISRGSFLTGHVLGSVIQTMISAGLVIGVAFLLGFRSAAGPVQWIAAIGLLTMLTFALTWLAVAIGLVSKTPESASNSPLLIQFLPFIGSAFVPPSSMPAGVRWFAEYQPFTPIGETIRGLLIGTPIGNNAVLAVAWCAGIGLLGYLWARAAYARTPGVSPASI